MRLRTRQVSIVARSGPTESAAVRRGLGSPSQPPTAARPAAGVVCCSVCGCLLCSFLHVCHVLLASVSTVLTYWAIRAVEMARSERLEVTECDIS